MPLRPLALVSVLALGDYLLWNWSLAAGHDIVALASGLTLPLLALACLWLFALTLARGLGAARRRTREVERARERRREKAPRGRIGATAVEPPVHAPVAASPKPSSRKLAA